MAAIWLVSALAAAAESPSRVVLLLPSCEEPGLSSSDVRTALELELHASELASLDRDLLLRVDSSCDAETSLRLHALWGRKALDRELRVQELPEPARARALALAAAELLTALRSPDRVEPEKIVLDEAAPAAPTPTPTPKRAGAEDTDAPSPDTDRELARDNARVRSKRRARSLGASLELRDFALETAMAGARVHYDWGKVGLGLSALFARQSESLGSVSALVLHGLFDWRLAELPFTASTSLIGGARGGFGVVSVSSKATAGALDTTVADPYLDLAAFSEVGTLLSRTRVALRVEVGYALGMTALQNEREIASYAGPFGVVLVDVAPEL